MILWGRKVLHALYQQIKTYPCICMTLWARGNQILWWGHVPPSRSYAPAEGLPITLSNMCVDTKIALYRTCIRFTCFYLKLDCFSFQYLYFFLCVCVYVCVCARL